MRLLYILLLLDTHSEKLPVITQSSQETKSVWSNDTNLQPNQQKKEKNHNATLLLIVLPTVVGLLILILTATLLIKWKKCHQNEPAARLISVKYSESNNPEKI